MTKIWLICTIYALLCNYEISTAISTQIKTKGMSICKDDSVYRERHYSLGYFLRNKIMKSLPTEKQKRSFLAKIEKNTNQQGCWRWIGKTAKNTGYGQFAAHSKEHRKNRYFLSHRFAFEFIANRHIPNDRVLDHLCRNRWCVNPEHLEVVTLRDNILRGVSPAAINAKKTHCKWGHRLSDDNIYTHPQRGSRDCKICRKRRCKEFFERQKVGV